MPSRLSELRDRLRPISPDIFDRLCEEMPEIESEQEADVIVWDGGNNDTPFYKPDINIVVFDPHRAGHETNYHPGETNMLMADIAIINKVDSADPEAVENRDGRFVIRTGTIIETPRAPVLSVNYPKGPSCIGAAGEDEA